ncbi:hypothetical protein RTH46_00825 [Pseudomonas sp. zfem004]|uniref:Copper resistance protein B n=1 Tax=Pseudomonas soli TaxID=1306993 RepID=A0ABU7GUN7_9PSED|nr:MULTISPECIES: hypothetical protein [Pseudomonas]MBH3308438.1 hypothetical protein [Pseudomonas mosselii]MBH3325046.1 hypothetical protein [Pseudomonas mosselii]MBS9759934.1 hypothetical protein [Pseudomonas mosselii]MDT3713713.1 hypothetical protein [Pseudomonas soli]MDT3729226.1 hypothetical protein [Pseudomonas soli]
MSKPMKRSAFFFSAAMVGLLAVYAPSSWSGENHDQHSQKSVDTPNAAKSNAGAKTAQDKQSGSMDHGSMKGMDHGSMEGMDHGSMEGMDHSKMMESQGGDKAKAGKDDQ